MSYLTGLTLRLTAGAAQLDEATRARHAGYLAGLQGADGGFPGRQGPGDLYYTGFALRGLALTGELNETIAARAADFLQSRLEAPLPPVDFLSLVSSAVLLETIFNLDVFARAGLDRRGAVLERTARLCRSDGGYAKTPRGASSTYHTFLTAACLELVGAGLPDADKTRDFARSRRRDDGGWVELAPLAQSGTNPTAAGIGLLRLLDALDEPTRQAAAAFLASMQSAEGGFLAHARAPAADLLSTFTGLVALADLDRLAAVDAASVARYARSLELPAGGFRGGAWDAATDAEYAFYGLGALALCPT